MAELTPQILDAVMAGAVSDLRLWASQADNRAPALQLAQRTSVGPLTGEEEEEVARTRRSLRSRVTQAENEAFALRMGARMCPLPSQQRELNHIAGVMEAHVAEWLDELEQLERLMPGPKWRRRDSGVTPT